MNPNSAIFYPKLSRQEVYSQMISSSVPYMSSVMENLFFDNLENEFVTNNKWLFEDDIKENIKTMPSQSNEDEESKREAFYEAQNERLLAMELGEYDCGLCDDEETKDISKPKTFAIKSRKGKVIITLK
jgi:hypothetical protein